MEGTPITPEALRAADLNVNNYTTFLTELGLKATTLRDPVKIKELTAEEQLWFKRLRRQQVM